MDNENGEKGTYTFSHTRGYIGFGNNLGIITIITFLIVIICTYKGNLDRLVTLYGILLLFMMYCLAEYLIRKFAYKIIMDFESRQIQFYIFHTRDIVTSNFDDIINIKINFYITFIIENREILYNDVQNKELLSLLKKIIVKA